MTASPRRLPLRMVDPAKLRAAWSAGHPYYEDILERRESPSIEKPIESMTLADLIATQDMEPLSESRRSFLKTGQGVASLETPLANAVDEDGSPITMADSIAGGLRPDPVPAAIFAIVPPGPRCLVPLVDLAADADDPFEQVEYDANRFPQWMYTMTDLVTRRQILWEQEQSQHGQVFRYQLQPTPDGRLQIKPTGRPTYATPEVRTSVMTKAVRAFFAAVGRVTTYDALQARVDLARDVLDDPIAARYFSANANEEQWRLESDDEPVMHSSYEFMPDDWWLDPVPGIAPMDQLAIHHRSAHRSPWELWHTAIRRDSSDPHEIGMDLITNAALETLLGVTDWTADGEPISEPSA